MDPQITLAIDYGTTFTSVASVVQPRQPHRSSSDRQVSEPHIVVNKNWLLSHGEFVASEVAYRFKNPRSQDESSLAWGSEIEHLDPREAMNFEVVRCAKAMLHKCQENNRLLKANKSPGKRLHFEDHKPNEDFLRKLFDYMFRNDNSVLKRTYPLETRDHRLRLQIILGVPAALTLPEQLDFIRLAGRAGMPKAMRVSEPEAMAAFHLRQQNSVEVGQVLVVVDAGGGTVDLITYKVMNLDPLELYECAIADGDCCGSMFLNENFEALALNKLKNMGIKQDRDLIVRGLLDRFEKVFKLRFTGSENFSSHLGLYDERKVEVRSDELRREVFGPVVTRIQALIRAQIAMTRKNSEADWELEKERNKELGENEFKIHEIILGGGLSANNYLFTEVEKSFPDTVVRRMLDCRTDVVRGLAYIGLQQGLVKQRRSKLNYGLISQYEWDGTMRRPDKVDGWMEEHTGKTLIPVVEWLILRGQGVSEDMTIKRCRTEFWDAHSEWATSHEIVVTTEDLPLDTGYTYWTDLPEDHQIFEVDTDMSELDKSFCTQKKSPSGIDYWKVPVTIKIRIQNGQMTYNVSPPLRTEWEHLCTLETAQNPNPALGSLSTRSLVVPASHTQSLLRLERRKSRKRKVISSVSVPQANTCEQGLQGADSGVRRSERIKKRC